MIYSTSRFAFCAAILLSLTAIVGCSSGSRSVNKVEFCPDNYNPMPLDDKSYGNKLEVKPGETFTPPTTPTADYAYQGAEFFYYDKLNDIKFHIVDVKDSSGTFKANVQCFGGRGAKASTVISFRIPLVSDFRINPDTNEMEIRTRTLIIDAQDRKNDSWFKKDLSVEEKVWHVGTPADTYAGFDDSVQIFASLKAPVYKGLWSRLVAHSTATVTDQKSGKNGELDIRTQVTLKQVTPDERNQLDNPPPPMPLHH